MKFKDYISNLLKGDGSITLNVFRTENTGMNSLGIAYRGTGKYYAIDKPFTSPFNRKEQVIKKIKIQIPNISKILDLRHYQKTNKHNKDSNIFYNKIIPKAQKLTKKTKNITLTTYYDLIQKIAIKNNIHGVISYIEPENPNDGIELVDYNNNFKILN